MCQPRPQSLRYVDSVFVTVYVSHNYLNGIEDRPFRPHAPSRWSHRHRATRGACPVQPGAWALLTLPHAPKPLELWEPVLKRFAANLFRE